MTKPRKIQAGVLQDGWNETNNLAALCLYSSQKHFNYIMKTNSHKSTRAFMSHILLRPKSPISILADSWNGLILRAVPMFLKIFNVSK